MLEESNTISYGDIKVEGELGRGAFGTVHKGIWRFTMVAVKELLNQKLSREGEAEFENEANIMAKLRSPYIVQFYLAQDKKIIQLPPQPDLSPFLADLKHASIVEIL
jgi:serine/threonine protein kinase